MRKRSNVDKHADANVVPSKRHRTDLDNYSGASQSDDWGIQVMSNELMNDHCLVPWPCRSAWVSLMNGLLIH